MTQVLAIADVERDKWVIIWQVAEEITAEVGDGASTPEMDRYRRKCIARIRKTINRARFLIVLGALCYSTTSVAGTLTVAGN